MQQSQQFRAATTLGDDGEMTNAERTIFAHLIDEYVAWLDDEEADPTGLCEAMSDFQGWFMRQPPASGDTPD